MGRPRTVPLDVLYDLYDAYKESIIIENGSSCTEALNWMVKQKQDTTNSVEEKEEHTLLETSDILLEISLPKKAKVMKATKVCRVNLIPNRSRTISILPLQFRIMLGKPFNRWHKNIVGKSSNVLQKLKRTLFLNLVFGHTYWLNVFQNTG